MEWVSFSLQFLMGITTGVIANIVTHYVPENIRSPVASLASWFWSILAVLYVFGALYLVKERWLLPIIYRVLVIPCVFLIICLLTYLLRAMKQKPWQGSSAVCLIPGAMIFAADSVLPKGVLLQCPRFVYEAYAEVEGFVVREEWTVYVLSTSWVLLHYKSNAFCSR